MITAFRAAETFNDERDDACYIKVIWCFNYSTCWHIWAEWYLREGDSLVRTHKKWYVDKQNMRYWHYGKHGPN